MTTTPFITDVAVAEEPPSPAARRQPDAEFLRLLASSKTREELMTAVQRRAPKNDREDLVQMALARAFERFELFPEGEVARLKYLCGMVRRMTKKKARRRHLEQRHTPLLETGEEDFGGGDEGKAHEARDLLRRIFADGEWTPTQQRMMIWAVRNAFGESYALIAGEEGVTEDHVKKEASRARALLRGKLMPMCIGISIVLMIVAIVKSSLPHPPDEAVPNPVPTKVEPAPVGPTPAVADAAKLRADGLAACERREWSKCVSLLDEAADADPKGDQAKEVQAARARASAALEEPRKKAN